MPTVQSVYLSDLRTQATHIQSGTTLQTDAPTDNQGKGELFSPTDLVATALATCMLTTMGIVARREGIDLIDTEIAATKIMSADLPRRIARIELVLTFQTDRLLSPAEQAQLEKAALTCPVAQSLHPTIEQAVTFRW